jgi:hypothetical protein
MIIKASGRPALILAVGLFALASPIQAATDGDGSAPVSKTDSTAAPVVHRTYRHASHHRRSYAHRKSHAIAVKADDDKKGADKEVAATAAGPDENKALASPDDSKAVPNITPSIANANAQMLLAGVQISAAAAIPTGTDFPATTAGNPPNASSDNATFMVAADQLNEVDRTLQESNSLAATATGANPQAAPAPAATMTSESSVWDQTSLIGKIFIGFGALLTMASAARMFVT